VTFNIDANGIVYVPTKDGVIGRVQQVRIQPSVGPSEAGNLRDGQRC
jgi:molecular chaperone DnaK (HSP70)